jgi:uncharacterized protein
MRIAVLLFLYAALSFTAATFTHFMGGSGFIAQAVAFAAPTLFVATIFANFRWQSPVLRGVTRVIAVAMGFFNFAFLAALLCWPLAWASAAWFPMDRAVVGLVLWGGAAALSTYGLVNAARLRVTRYTIRLPNLPEVWRGREVALVTDVHVGAIWGPGRVRRIVTLLLRLQPHAVFISGDLFDGPKIDLGAAVAPWAACRVPAGTYFVTGNHDEFRDPAPYLEALTTVGVRVLANEKVMIEGLQLLGIHDSYTHHPAAYQEVLDRARIDPARPSILLSHRPVRLEIPEAAGVSLQLAGHTHNGQFAVWTWLVRALYGRYAYGLHRIGGLQLITSSGASTGGPPLRVGTRSEIVLIRLDADDANTWAA